MSISFVGAQGAAAATVTIPAHQVGDMILIFAFRDGSTTAPTTPTAGGTVPTWTLISSTGANNCSANFRYAVATATTTTSGTWTNATEIICLVYRGAKLVGVNGAANGASTIISYPALTLQRTEGSSWVVGCAGHRTATNVELAPTGMTNRTFIGTEAAGHDTNGGVSSWVLRTVTVNANSGWRGVTVELRDATVVLTADAGSFNGTFIDAALERGFYLNASAGAYTHTGNDAVLTKTGSVNKVITADVGTFTELGRDVGLIHAARLTADKSTYAVNGVDATLRHAVVIAAAKGAFTETGNDAGLQHTAILVAEKVTYTLTGNNADLHYVAGIDLNGEVGQFLVSGNAATLRKSYVLVAASRQFNVNGISANIIYVPDVVNDSHWYYQINEMDPRKMVVMDQPNNDQFVYYLNQYLRIL
jgi:hypothetical protein